MYTFQNVITLLTLFIVSVLFFGVDGSSAQIQASERSTTTQVIDGTVVTIDYARPSRRGRDPIFGGIFYMEWPEGPLTAAFAPVSDRVFNPIKMMDGEPAGLWDDVFFEFEVDANGDVLNFEARTILDELWMSGKRID